MEKILQVTQILAQKTVDSVWLKTSFCLEPLGEEGPRFLFMHNNLILPHSFLLFFPTSIYITLPRSCPHSSPAVCASPSLHIVLLFPCCATLLCAMAAA